MRERFFPKPSTKLDEDVLRVNMNLAQDLVPKVKSSRKFSGNETLDLVKGLSARAKAKDLIIKPVKEPKIDFNKDFNSEEE